MKIILIMGLPGAGKTTLAEQLAPKLNAKRLNADEVRKTADDWDFSEEGRRRQCSRMKSLADFESENGRLVICDFICPTEDLRKSFNADFSIWMDTVKTSNYKDTDSIFQPPEDYDLRFRKWDQYSPKEIAKLISDV